MRFLKSNILSSSKCQRTFTGEINCLPLNQQQLTDQMSEADEMAQPVKAPLAKPETWSLITGINMVGEKEPTPPSCSIL